MYFMGERLDCIKPNYILAIQNLEKCWTPYGYYLQMLWLLSIGILPLVAVWRGGIYRKSLITTDNKTAFSKSSAQKICR